MKIEELKEILKGKGFKEEKQDTGYKYTIEEGHVKLLCYIEPGMDVQFISFYRWNNNDVKGTYDVSIEKLKRDVEPISIIFKRTISNLPECIGDKANAHTEVKEAIEQIFE